MPALAGHVARRRHGDDTGERRRGGRVDAEDLGARVLREDERGVEQAVALEIVREGALPEDQRGHLEPVEPRADAAGARGRIDARAGGPRVERLAAPQPGEGLHGRDDARVSAAAAEVHVEAAGNLCACRRRVVREERVRVEREAGQAEAALPRGVRLEGEDDLRALLRGQPFEGEHVAPVDRHRRLVARRAGVAVHDGDARAALSLRLATVLHGRQTEPGSQGVEEVLAFSHDNADRLAIEGEARLGHGARRCKTSATDLRARSGCFAPERPESDAAFAPQRRRLERPRACVKGPSP